MRLATWIGMLFFTGAVAGPAVAYAGAAQIAYQQKKAAIAAKAQGPNAQGSNTPGSNTPGSNTPGSNTQGSAAVAGTTVLDVARQQGMFTTFVAAVEAAGLVEVLKQPGPYTVFAPTDDAFAAIPAGELQTLLRDTPRLKQLLAYHIVPQKKYDWDMRRDVLRTLDGRSLTVNQYTSPEDIRLNTQAEVLETNIRASNGVLHAIDRVMMPQG